MKRVLFFFLALVFLMPAYADYYESADSSPSFSVRTLEFKKPGDQSYLRVYIKIPVSSVELKKETTREGQMLYKSKVRFTVVVESEGKELGKDKWKSTNLVADNLSSRLYIFDFTHFEVPAGKEVEIKVDVEDIYAKKKNNITIEKKINDFNGLSISQPLWASQIRDLKPEDRSNTKFFSLYINPMIDNVFFSPGYPFVYFEVYGLTPNEEDEYNYTITYTISRPGDKEAFYTYIDRKEGEFLEESDIIIIPSPPVLDILSLVESGDWSVRVNVEDNNAEVSVFYNEILTKKL